MNAEELDDALSIVRTQRPIPGAWVPEQVARRDIKAAFVALERERDEAKAEAASLRVKAHLWDLAVAEQARELSQDAEGV